MIIYLGTKAGGGGGGGVGGTQNANVGGLLYPLLPVLSSLVGSYGIRSMLGV